MISSVYRGLIPYDRTWHGFASAGTFSGKQWKHSPSPADMATDSGTDSAEWASWP
jgi:hypothetical protein